MANTSSLSRIDLDSDDPIDLFKNWHAEAKKFSTGLTNICCFSTVSVTNKPRSRHVLLRQYDETGFVFVTDSRSRKSNELAKNNSASLCIFWIYTNDKNVKIWRQARIEGNVLEIPRNEAEVFYNADPLYCKIRTHICHQDNVVDWNEMKERHDKLLVKAKEDSTILSMPDHFVGYKVVPSSMEFYYTQELSIADRIEFEKSPEGTWKHQRLAA